jgi:hypothetical protein
MSAIKLSAQKVKDQSNLQKIAEAWKECAVNRGWEIDSFDRKGDKAYHWEFLLNNWRALVGPVFQIWFSMIPIFIFLWEISTLPRF